MNAPHTTPGCCIGRPLTMYRPYTPTEAREAADQLTEELKRIARDRAWARQFGGLAI